MEDKKRLFFGFEIACPWPHELPKARLIAEENRHMTFAFLGSIVFTEFERQLSTFPKPSFQVGLVGEFDRTIFLPKRHPKVVAWHVEWLEEKNPLLQFHEKVTKWLKDQGLDLKRSDFMPHVTVGRVPFESKEWLAVSNKLPMMIKGIHLYESMGNLIYESRWSYAIFPPFNEIEHTADLAFHIYGEDLLQIYRHAQVALIFKFPELLRFFDRVYIPEAIEDVIIKLNELVAISDQEIGCPFKAVSFHGDVTQKQDGVLSWEMIIDV